MTTSDVHGVITISYPLEKLAITIIERKEKLKFPNEIYSAIKQTSY